jgi:hypothetical protein
MHARTAGPDMKGRSCEEESSQPCRKESKGIEQWYGKEKVENLSTKVDPGA